MSEFLVQSSLPLGPSVHRIFFLVVHFACSELLLENARAPLGARGRPTGPGVVDGRVDQLPSKLVLVVVSLHLLARAERLPRLLHLKRNLVHRVVPVRHFFGSRFGGAREYKH